MPFARLALGKLQVIQPVPVDAEQYVAENYQRQIRPPPECPHCNAIKSLWAHCYYLRNLTRIRASNTLRFFVRRFKCHRCKGTVSILPSFAQPYRVVQNATIEGYFKGPPFPDDVQRWTAQLRRYWLRFMKWIPEIEGVLGDSLGRSPPHDAGCEWRSAIAAAYGEMDVCTMRFVSIFQITLFGRYRCHQPNDQMDEQG